MFPRTPLYLVGVQDLQESPVDLRMVQEAVLDLVDVADSAVKLHGAGLGGGRGHGGRGGLGLALPAGQGQGQSAGCLRGPRGRGEALWGGDSLAGGRAGLRGSRGTGGHAAHSDGHVLPLAWGHLVQTRDCSEAAQAQTQGGFNQTWGPGLGSRSTGALRQVNKYNRNFFFFFF